MRYQKKYNVGDKVMALWPGSKLYYPAELLEFVDNSFVKIRYEDGVEIKLAIKNIHKFRTKSKSKSRSRSRSPGRRRSRSRSKSPSRTVLHKQEDTKMKTEVSTSKQSIHFTKKISKVKQEISNLTTIPSPTKEKVMPKTTFSFIDHILAIIGYMFVPAASLYFPYFCNNNSCYIETSIKDLINSLPKQFADYFDLTASFTVIGYVLLQAIIYVLPLGKIIDGPLLLNGKKLKYRLNAANNLVITTLIYSILVYNKYPVTLVYYRMLPITSMAIVVVFSLHVVSYVKSFWSAASDINPKGNSGWHLVDMYTGREIVPRFGNMFDLKMYAYNIGITSVMLMNLIYLQVAYEKYGNIRIELLLSCGLNIAYTIAMFFSNEEKNLYSYDIREEGFGFNFLFGVSVFYPIIYTMQPRYILEHPDLPELHNFVLSLAIALFVLGVTLTYKSDRQKYFFRRNPHDPKITNLQSLPPSKKGGHRLLISGYWGYLRHPNYLGEILITVALSFLCGTQRYFIWCYPAFVTILLTTRSLLDEKGCEKKHGKAWEKYCKLVKYRVFPGIF